MGQDLRGFIKSFFDDPPMSLEASRVWMPRRSLPNLKDERLDFDLPSDCLDPRSKKPLLEQVIVRGHYESLFEVGARKQIWYYYSSLNHYLLMPQQMSFLLLHEFLWDYTSDVRAIRQVNFVLHSTAFPKMTRAEVEAVLDLLKSSGFKAPSVRIDIDLSR